MVNPLYLHVLCCTQIAPFSMDGEANNAVMHSYITLFVSLLHTHAHAHTHLMYTKWWERLRACASAA